MIYIFNYLILLSIAQIKSERSTASIFHIIAGRKSVQAIQDAHLYQLTNFYSIYEGLKREDFEATILELQDQNYLTIDPSDNARLTNKGEKYIIDHNNIYPIADLKGMRYAGKVKPFIGRLFLTIQTYVNIAMGNKRFYPVIEDLTIQNWFKSYYDQNRDVKAWLINTQQELNRMLQMVDEQQAALFVERLTGYHRYGLTTQQLAVKHHLSIHDVSVRLTAIYHNILHAIEENKMTHLALFIQQAAHQHVEKFMTQSAQKTYRLTKQGYSIAKIAKLRGLKENTIEDHIVELSYQVPDFNLTAFIDQEDLTYILTKLNSIEDHRLSNVKKTLDDRFSYFQIRMALASANLLEK